MPEPDKSDTLLRRDSAVTLAHGVSDAIDLNRTTVLATNIPTIYTRIEKWQTRVLRLHSGSYGEPLEADLLVANLVALDSGLVLHGEEKLVEYDAVSYTWGSGALTPKSFAMVSNRGSQVP